MSPCGVAALPPRLLCRAVWHGWDIASCWMGDTCPADTVQQELRAVPKPQLSQEEDCAQAQGGNRLPLAAGSFLPGKVFCSCGSRENKSFSLALHGAVRWVVVSPLAARSTLLTKLTKANKDVAMTA